MAHLQASQKVASADMACLMILAMAASYHPDPGSAFGVRLPIDLDTCQLIADRRQRCLTSTAR
jgi:hypothetical protein